MAHRWKTFGLTLVAVVSVAAMAAPLAQAEFQFTSESETPYEDMTLTGEQLELSPNGFTLAKGAALRCNEVKYEGTTTGATGTLTPTYTECEMYKEPASVTGFGAKACDWHLTGKVELKCPAEQDVEIDTAWCTITIQPQGNLKQISWKAGSDNMDVDFTWELESIQYEYIGGFACEIVSGIPVATLYSDGKYEGTMTLLDEDRIQKKQIPMTIDE